MTQPDAPTQWNPQGNYYPPTGQVPNQTVPNQQYAPAPQYPGQPYQPYQAYQPYGAPPPKKPIWLFVLIGVVVLALIVFLIWWFALRNTPAPTPPPPPATTTTTTEPTVVIPTVPAQDVVNEFMQAVASGDSATALSFMATAPSDTTFLTDDVLAKSNELAPITNISVTPPSGADATSVAVSYSLGEEQESTTFGVTIKDGNYALTDAITPVDLSGYYMDSLGIALNGVPMDGTSVMGINLFPGSYQLTVGNVILKLSDGNFAVTGPNQTTASSSDIVFSSAAHSKLAKAVTDRLKHCLNQKKLVTDCRFGVKGSPSLRTSTIKWRITSGSSDFSKTKFTLDDSLTLATASIKVSVKVTWTGSNGRSYYIDPIAIKHAYVDFSDPSKIDVQFGY